MQKHIDRFYNGLAIIAAIIAFFGVVGMFILLVGLLANNAPLLLGLIVFLGVTYWFGMAGEKR